MITRYRSRKGPRLTRPYTAKRDQKTVGYIFESPTKHSGTVISEFGVALDFYPTRGDVNMLYRRLFHLMQLDVRAKKERSGKYNKNKSPGRPSWQVPVLFARSWNYIIEDNRLGEME